MTISTTTNRYSYSGNGTTTAFSYVSKFLANADLVVLLVDEDGISATQVLNTDYTVTGAGVSNGGTVTMTTAPASGETLVIYGNPAITQTLDLVNNDSFDADDLEETLDRSALINQRQKDLIDRSLRLADSDVSGATVEIATTGKEGYYLRLNVAGTAFELAEGEINTSTFTQSGTNAVERSVTAKLGEIKSKDDFATFADYVTAAILNVHFGQNGAYIHRFTDRVLIGHAAKNDGVFPNVTQDWLTEYQIAAGLGSGIITSSTAAVLTAPTSGSACAFTAGSQSLGSVSAGASTIGLSAFAINNNTTLATNAWAFYAEAHKENATCASTYAIETDTRSLVASITPTPWQQGDTIGYQIGAGCGLSATGQFDCSAAIQIVDNPMQWKAGINFMHNSLDGTDGTTGFGNAINFAAFQGMTWYNSSGAAVGRINTTNTDATKFTELRFNGLGAAFLGSGGQILFSAFTVASAVNYLAASPAVTGGAPNIAAVGTDADIDVYIAPKGSGLVRFGTKTGTGDVAVDGYVNIKTAAGSTIKLATVA